MKALCFAFLYLLLFAPSYTHASEVYRVENSSEFNDSEELFLSEDRGDGSSSFEAWFGDDPYLDPSKKWYVALKPGYFYFTDATMRRFFEDGGFIMRFEAGCRVWDYLMVWMDGSYFEKKGESIGGATPLNIRLATLTLGLKGIYFFNQSFAVYGGMAPRLYMMMLHNATPFIRGDDNAIGIGGAFTGGIWFFPISKWENFFFDVFVDYSLKTLKIEPDEISSFDYDVDISGVSAGIGVGLRF